MKKFLSMALATAMTMSMASVAFAADTNLKYMIDKSNVVGEACYYDDDAEDIKSVKYDSAHQFVYGDTVYYPIRGIEPDAEGKPGSTMFTVYESDAVKGLKLKADWQMGKDYVKSTSLVKKKTDGSVLKALGGTEKTLTGGQSYAYYVAVSIKDSLTTKTTDIYGKISLDKSATKNSSLSGSDKKYDDELDYKENSFDVNLSVAYNPKGNNKDGDYTVEKDRKTFYFDNENDEEEIVIIDSDTATFTVDTRGQGKLTLSANNDFNASISAKYPNANLDFINVEASDSFNKIGTLRVYAEEGKYLYALDKSGNITNAKAKYDDADECYVMRTRTLGSFVISDTELEVKAPEVEAPQVEEVKPSDNTGKPFNPGTGAAC